MWSEELPPHTHIGPHSPLFVFEKHFPLYSFLSQQKIITKLFPIWGRMLNLLLETQPFDSISCNSYYRCNDYLNWNKCLTFSSCTVLSFATASKNPIFHGNANIFTVNRNSSLRILNIISFFYINFIFFLQLRYNSIRISLSLYQAHVFVTISVINASVIVNHFVFDPVIQGSISFNQQVGSYNEKGSFGELALMYNTPR